MRKHHHNTASLHYPFGMNMEEYFNEEFRYSYGFQNQEKVDEGKGKGNTYSFLYRIHDSRLGRFLSVDPLTSEFAWFSPYVFSENKLIAYKELEGAETILAINFQNFGVTVLQVQNSAGSLSVNNITIKGIGSIIINDKSQYGASNNKARGLYGQGGWSINKTGNAFDKMAGNSTLTYGQYRPILWKSYRDGTKQESSSQVITKNIVTKTLPISSITASVKTIQSGINTVLELTKSLNETRPINPVSINSTETVATITHPDVADQLIRIVQTRVGAGQMQITNAGNIVVTITANNADAASINTMVAQMQTNGKNAGVQFKPVFDDTTTAGTFGLKVDYDETRNTNARVTTTTTATDTTKGQNIPQEP